MLNAKDWRSWEVDPSTRQSVHVWNKYQPVDSTLTTAGTAQNLLSIARTEPALNMVTNPSVESATITMYTASGAAISQSTAQASDGSNSLLVNPANAAAAEGFYWSHAFAGHTEGTHICAQAEVRGASGSGDARLEIHSSAGVVLATSDTITLSTGFQRMTISYQIPERTAADYRIAVVSVTNHNIDFYVDKIGVEQRRDGAVQPYIDGSLGVNYEWFGTAHLSVSKLRPGISVARGFKLTNGHGSQTVYIALDTTASATTGVLLKAGETWETLWPLDIRTNISALASGASTQVYGVVYGVHQG